MVALATSFATAPPDDSPARSRAIANDSGNSAASGACRARPTRRTSKLGASAITIDPTVTSVVATMSIRRCPCTSPSFARIETVTTVASM